MRYLFICNRFDPFIKELQEALIKKGAEITVLQINGLKVFKNLQKEELQIKTPVDFLKDIPKLKVIHKIFSLNKAIFSFEGFFDHIVLFFYDWRVGFLLPSIEKKSKKVSLYLNRGYNIDKKILHKIDNLIVTDNITAESFKKNLDENFSKKLKILPKIVNFDRIKEIKNKSVTKSIYCDIREVEKIEDFIKSIENLNYEFIFPLIGEPLERRRKIEIILNKSTISYKIPKGFISFEKNYELIANSEAVIAFCNPQNSDTIQLSLFANKFILILGKYFSFFSKNKFHFVTIHNMGEIGNYFKEINKLNKFSKTNKNEAIKEFSSKEIANKFIKILEKK